MITFVCHIPTFQQQAECKIIHLNRIMENTANVINHMVMLFTASLKTISFKIFPAYVTSTVCVCVCVVSAPLTLNI